MRKTSWALIGVAAIMASGAPIADAAVTCKLIHSWCPAPEKRIGKEGRPYGRGDRDDPPATAVPEPAMLMLLGSGVAAVAAAAVRRRKK